jgi:hypothetical protein
MLYDDEREVLTTKGEVDDGERGCCVQGWDDVWWRFDKRNEVSIIVISQILDLSYSRIYGLILRLGS